jgi:sugar fermentation stimulation protein A
MKIEILEAKIINRLSKKIKSPYIADIEINNKEELAHNPSLGLGGLIDKNINVLVSKCKSDCRKSKYTIELVKYNKIIIGANPLFANTIFSNFYTKFNEFKDYIIFKQEVKIYDSRIDFLLKKSNEKFYVEIKNVPLVKTENDIITAIFPDGYKKTNNLCISDRAYKHIIDLIKLKKEGNRVGLVFIVQRCDPDIFSPNYLKDKIYSEKLKEAYSKGVEMYAYKFKWSIKNNIAKCKFIKRIDIQFY